MRISNDLWQRGHLTVCFPLLLGKRSRPLQCGHLRNLCVLSSLILRSVKEPFDLMGFHIFVNFSFSKRRLEIFLENDLKNIHIITAEAKKLITEDLIKTSAIIKII